MFMSSYTPQNVSMFHSTMQYPVSNSGSIEKQSIRFVRALGIRPNLMGYHLLITAICVCAENPQLYQRKMKGLYPCVAQYYGISAGCVERNIRTAIEDAYNINAKQLQGMFYYNVGKPSISEVIALALEHIKFYMN